MILKKMYSFYFITISTIAENNFFSCSFFRYFLTSLLWIMVPKLSVMLRFITKNILFKSFINKLKFELSCVRVKYTSFFIGCIGSRFIWWIVAKSTPPENWTIYLLICINNASVVVFHKFRNHQAKSQFSEFKIN